MAKSLQPTKMMKCCCPWLRNIAPWSVGVSHLVERMAFKSTTNRSHLRFTREVCLQPCFLVIPMCEGLNARLFECLPCESPQELPIYSGLSDQYLKFLLLSWLHRILFVWFFPAQMCKLKIMRSLMRPSNDPAAMNAVDNEFLNNWLLLESRSILFKFNSLVTCLVFIHNCRTRCPIFWATVQILIKVYVWKPALFLIPAGVDTRRKRAERCTDWATTGNCSRGWLAWFSH